MKRAQSFIGDLIQNYLQKEKLLPQEEEKKENEVGSAKIVPNSSGAKVLVVTHGGFIMEYLNAVRLMSGR